MSFFRSLAALVLLLGWQLAQADPVRMQVDVKADFETARSALIQVLAEHGLKVAEELDISGMLDRTGKDLQLGPALYSKGHAFGFCSAVLSRDMMAADPKNISFCPFTIYLYALPGEKGVTHLAWRPLQLPADSPASAGILSKINQLLAEIARQTVAEAF